MSSELWGGYISSYKFHDKWSVWNDFHYVPTAFWANRHGLTYHVSQYGRLTAGYAFVTTATSFTSQLRRSEHRPWAQFQVAKPWNDQRSWRVRVRYDRRIRRAIEAGDFAGGWTAYNRWRLMLSASQRIKTYPGGNSLHIHLMNEVLVNNGRQFSGETLDQNRSYLMLALNLPGLRIMGGTHMRAIPTSDNSWNYRYGLTVWVIHSSQSRVRTLP
ncbi:MAG: DUF2490 domain-containing protein [Cryomorphaceae bacterium]|nr:DUF2490 domain-containing protein [Flavobacteriales bacterium]